MDNQYRVLRKAERTAPAFMEGNTEGTVAWLKMQKDTSTYEIWSESTGYLTVADFLNQVVNVVPKFYDMDPKTEDMLPSGRYLANGMKVLIASSNTRSRTDDLSVDWVHDAAITNNRWCTVTHLEVINNHTRFVGVYEDGTKRMRVAATTEAWLVKIDSITEANKLATARYAEVFALIEDAMTVAMEIDSSEEPDGDKVNQVIAKAEAVTTALLGTFR
jgi:hypothetical protein